ncbi:site-specific DNA-methyltransferase [Aeromicrobium halocynthiae]|uniref:Site-specific DNA-methyltransferase n=1 Tax=Aeromicrobium halocynthiae TaxID=560557 RepID=A0ABP5HID7_9ACTN
MEATTHGDKRPNIPTVDAQDLVDPELQEDVRIRLERRMTSPELLWKGKSLDGLDVEAPPIYIQEKVDPRVLVENLRKTAATGEPEPELTLFDTFDGLDELDSVDFYRHEANWSNRMILGDSLQVMGSLAEREALRGQVQMVYIDPPYGIKFGSNWQVSARKRDVKDGKREDAAREAEQIKAFRDTWELGIHSYLSYLRDRLVVARDLLTESGSCFVQIGEENVHLVRSLMDEVFGAENFVSQIAFATTSGFVDARGLSRSGDFILWFAKDVGRAKVRPLWRRGGSDSGYNWVMLADGERRPATADEKSGNARLPDGAQLYRNDNLRSQGASKTEQRYEYGGRSYLPGPQLHWKAKCPEGLDRLAAAGRIHNAGSSLEYVRYKSDSGWQPYTNTWSDTVIGGFTDEKIYVVQTTTKVISRCMLLCTDPGDLVLDPTCGSGTTAQAAEHWGRRWITIDTSRVALALARQRLMGARFPFYLLADSEAGRAKESSLSATPLPPAQVTNDIRHGFVYERVQRITLGSIANNPDIVEGMSREEIDAAITRHADFEMLYDKPYEDRKTVRVTGPFTVESLSPHRSLAFAGTDDRHETQAEAKGAADSEHFEQTILDNLTAAGIQNGAKGERIHFASVEPYAGAHIQAVGERVHTEASHAAPSRVAIALGPQYGTVSQSFIKGAAKEAITDASIDLLCVLGFAFDAQASDVKEVDDVALEPGFAEVENERRVGRLPVLFVRMNVDLLMGEELKKTGAGNLFTVFGEPDIDVRTEPGQDGEDQVVVEIRGVDVFDPTTGNVRSVDTGQIALWMIDTDYDGESFFVRHCYFTGGNDPYKRLKTALKADIDPDAWSTLYATTSRPFDLPSTGKIAVKAINDYGDEVMKVFDVPSR